MANDNNKTNKLVSSSDDDPTAELEIPGYFSDEREPDDQALEGDANTSGFEQAEVQTDLDEESIAALKSGLESRTERINRLQFDIEQLRAKWTGLETEIQAREEITNNLNADLSLLNGKLEASESELGKRERALEKVTHELEQVTQSAKQSSGATEQIRRAAKKDKVRIGDLEKRLAANDKKISTLEHKLEETQSNQRQDIQKNVSHDRQLGELEKQLAASRASLSDLRQYVDGRKDRWAQREAELAQVKSSLENSADEIDKLSRIVEIRDTHLQRGQTRIDRLSRQLATQVSECKTLRADNRKLRHALRDDAEKEIERNHHRIAEQSGKIKGHEHEIRELAAQASRTEEYANDLRRQLQIQSDLAEAEVNKRQRLQLSVQATLDNSNDLTKELERARRQNSELAERISELESGFAEEVRQIRFELGSAQQTISDQESLNEELASDLFDNRGFRQALEAQLSETEDQYEQTIRDLEQKTNKLRNQAEEYQHKLENKDQAIAALMDELASRSQTIESIGEIEDVIHEIGDRMSERIDEQNQSDRERVTRLLIGKTDGQELRFPLFKDRLTIGRTAHNDIQLKAQFISRRHAVIVTENCETRIVDWGSKNGVYINEQRVTERTLKNGDVVTIGTTDFRYEERPKR